MTNTKEVTVPILDQDNCFLSNTTSARARILLKKGKVSIFQKDPFILKMKGEENPVMIKKSTQSSFIKNFATYFAEEKEVYVQNMSASNISLEIPSPSGPVYISIARTRKPMNLTMYVSFDVLKQSSGFRRLVNRNPPVLNLLDEDQFEAYYAKQADAENTSVDDAMRKGQEVHDILLEKRKPSTEELKKSMEEKAAEKAKEEEAVVEPSPRIVGLCAQADKENGSEQLSASAFLEELEIMEAELTEEDYEFVSARGYYKSVKSFATKKLAALTDNQED